MLPELAGAPAAFRQAVRIIARSWVAGVVTFVLPSGRELRIEGARSGPEATLIVRDFRFMRRVLTGGDIGFAEGFMAEEWDTPDLSALLVAFSLNWDRLSGVVEGHPVMQVLNRVGRLFRANTRRGARRNIHAHYDLGNAFYSQWLDPTMTYSSARYARPGQPLEQAQANKYRTLAKSMDLQSDQSVLEIGCGWGGFAEFAAREVGAKVTAITISREQYDFARRRMFEQGLAERADIQLIDYRDVEGSFDRVASIEMFEAVGERYWPAYFDKIRQVLAPGGRAGLQIITIADELFEDYRRRADFIQRYVFPGGMLPSEARLRRETDRAGLVWRETQVFGQHYADTLTEWSTRFEAAWGEIRRQGFDERFHRLWRFYLSYCEAGFRTGRTNVVQLCLAKP
ncbi:MAG: cyclopropane-fatty-acyl-phospholipid synthase family protein [Phenylobacterium sp.]|uniref:SAM-dependent methyltransferase n=1 Tax=Phenylobacterium sp. TaxID=1871053 RepID=UPI00273282EC|nr:cyclopropane-fatty-acyl-phospholipid synthase family protein [Phenylobacterium sp.]MDP3176128.1 cyclopropane-fatty-acyl-phospholipid synthase family protein [Phenylobacterium sp.]